MTKTHPSSSIDPSRSTSVKDAFDLTGRVAIITGGAGFFGQKHAEAIAEMGGSPVILDVDIAAAEERARSITHSFGVKSLAVETDVTLTASVKDALSKTLDSLGRIDVLINNAGVMMCPEWRTKEGFEMQFGRHSLHVRQVLTG